MDTVNPTPITNAKPKRKLATATTHDADGPARTVFVDEDPVPTEPTGESTITIPVFGSNGREGQVDYVEAKDLAKIVNRLIDDCPEFSRLEGFRVRVLWKRQGGNQNGVPRMVDAKPCNGIETFAFKADFLVWVAADHAAEAQLSDGLYEKYLFHALCHCGVKVDDRDESETPTRRPHDLEMFYEEYARYGAWRPELAQARDVVSQTRMDFGDEDVATMRARI